MSGGAAANDRTVSTLNTFPFFLFSLSCLEQETSQQWALYLLRASALCVVQTRFCRHRGVYGAEWPALLQEIESVIQKRERASERRGIDCREMMASSSASGSRGRAAGARARGGRSRVQPQPPSLLWLVHMQVLLAGSSSAYVCGRFHRSCSANKTLNMTSQLKSTTLLSILFCHHI